MNILKLIAVICSLLLMLVSGCATYTYREPLYSSKIEPGTVLHSFSLDAELQDKALLLNPERVTDKDVRDVLSKGPAPRIINIHGGIYPVHLVMKSFSLFLIGMGYPEAKIRNPVNGSYSFSCYESSEKIAGAIAWYYEREGLRPMIIGHSQGGMQTIKVLYEMTGAFNDRLSVWNPIGKDFEERYTIIDPLTGLERPVIKVKASYATAVGAGGLTRIMPNQWIMSGRLRDIPGSVEEFTGFFIGFDVLGGDLFGFDRDNLYVAKGNTRVRNVFLPSDYNHYFIPSTEHLIESEETTAWINSYVPNKRPKIDVEFKSDSTNILWAADVWYSIKKHWVIEVQRLIRSQRGIKDQ